MSWLWGVSWGDKSGEERLKRVGMEGPKMSMSRMPVV